MGRRSTAIKVTLILFIIFLPLALWIWRTAAVASAWGDMEREVARLLAESRARSGARPVLRGEPQPGKAWEKYDEAIRLLGNWAPRGGGPLIPESPEWYAQEMKAFAPAAVPFREGVSRGDGQRDRHWEVPEQPVSTDILCLVETQAQVLLDAGKPLEAARWLLDAIQFCGDLGRDGSLEDCDQANHRRAVGMGSLRKLLESDRLGQAEFSEIASELERADQAFPSLRDSLLNTAMSQGCLYLDLSRRGSLLRPGEKVSWRHLFSERVVVSSAFFAQLNALRRIGEAEELPWPEARDIPDKALSLVKDSLRFSACESLARRCIPEHRGQRAQLRLLRAAAHYRATGLFALIPDPFGTTLLQSQKDGRVKIWSVGEDGVDDGGSGIFYPEGKDLVIEPRAPK